MKIASLGIAPITDQTSTTLQRSAKRGVCLLPYSQAEPGRELTQPWVQKLWVIGYGWEILES